MRSFLLCGALALSLLGARASQAQFTSFATGSTWNNAGSALIASHLWYDAQRKAMLQSFRKGAGQPAQRPGARRPSRDAGKPPAADPRALIVGPVADSGALASLARSLTPDAGQQRQLTDEFRKGLASFEAQAGQFGKPRSLASAMAFFVASTYSVAAQRDVEDSQLAALARQLTDTMASNARMAGVSAGDKRRLYDLLVVLGMVAASGYQQARSEGKAADAESYRRLARESLLNLFGVAPEKLHPSSSRWTVD